jgi:hypothetical protein
VIVPPSVKEVITVVKNGDKFKSTFTGQVYGVKKIRDSMVLLEAENGSTEVLTEKKSLELFYKKEGKKDEG